MFEEAIVQAFKSVPVGLESHAGFFDGWELFDFNRNEEITEVGKTEKYFYIVLEGVQAIYYATANGDQKVIGFSFGGSFSGVYDSYLTQQPSNYCLKAITPSRLIGVRKHLYDSWFKDYPEFDRWGRLIHQELLIGRVQRELELTTLSSKERFDTFMKRCPKELMEIPQKYLASYLNMTPETFSRLRGSIS